MHVSNAFQIPEGEKLAKKLCKKTFADYVIFQNSGPRLLKLLLKLQEDIFTQLENPTKQEFYVLKILFMEEL